MIVLDTHAWVWWVSNPKQLSKKAQSAIDKAMREDGIYISSISVWEIAMLVYRKRLVLSMDVRDWVAKCENLKFMHFAPITNSIAIKAVQLEGTINNDPADRIIIATALSFGAALVTMDKKIRNSPYIETVW